MHLFNSQIHWRGMGTIVVVELLILLAVAVAVVSYVEWSSNSAVAEFTSAATSSPSDPSQSNGGTGCPKGKKSLPTQVKPLP
jgi:hypothetical protein